tara:strand:- start:1140 stop:1349 length:210 start_codon:yes stop_codon:yes gene_type:complete
MESHEIVIKKLLRETSLETRFKVYLEMMDYENWDNGTYKGDQSEIVNTLLEDVEEYLNDTPDPKSNLYE